MAEQLKIIPLGGLNEIGKNMTVYEYGGEIIVVDCGMAFPGDDMYGIDCVIPDVSYLVKHKNRIRGMFITHGHEDHIGGVPYLLKLRPDIPLIGSKLTLAFVDAKCKEHHQNPTKVEVAGREKLKVGPFDLEFVNVTHSIPDALAVYVKTPAGSLIDTGDIKLDQLPLDHRITDLVEFGKIGEKGVDLLMMDSTNAEVPGFVKPETSIGPALDQAFAQATRKIIVASFSSHVHRVQQVVDAAHKYGRKVVFVGPCDSKKLEARRESVRSDVDFVLTFEEALGIFAAKGMDKAFPPEDEEEMPAYSSRDARRFAYSGGVAQAVVNAIHDMEPDREVKVAAATGLADCRKLLMMAKAGKYDGYLLEGMACPGGCIAGAGTLRPIEQSHKEVEAFSSEAKFTCANDTPYMDYLPLIEEKDKIRKL